METKLDQPNELVQDQDHAARSLDASHVLTWEEIASLAAESGKPAETLMNLVALIARRFGTDVCSAYLLEPDRANLVLAATLGLRQRMRRQAAHGS
jgi:signal transduction protein with GAF and PtsI domain